MNHLTDEQFEDILQGAPEPDHIRECPECRERLAEKRALAERLRRTFTSIGAGSDLAARIEAKLGGVSESPSPTEPSRPRTILLAAHRRLWSALAAAAILLVVAIPAGLYFNTASQARAAQTELVGIHKQNLASMDELFVHEDPNELAGHLQSETGHSPATVCTGSGLTVCGCCTRQFQGRTVGSYVVQTPSGPVSVVIVPDSPQSLGMTPGKGQPSAERPIWRASCEGCSMAAVRIGGRSYCALGRVTTDDLAVVLDSLLE